MILKQKIDWWKTELEFALSVEMSCKWQVFAVHAIASTDLFTGIIVRNFFQKPSHGFKLSKLCHLWNTSSNDLALEKNDIFRISYSNCCQTSTSCASLHYCLLLFIESNSRWFSWLFDWITKLTFFFSFIHTFREYFEFIWKSSDR